MNDTDSCAWHSTEAPRPIRNTVPATIRYLMLMALAIATPLAGAIYGICKFVGWVRG
jgi:hypothetical protein